ASQAAADLLDLANILSLITDNTTVLDVLSGPSGKPVAATYCAKQPLPTLGSCPTVTLSCNQANTEFSGLTLDFGSGPQSCGCTIRGHAYSGSVSIGSLAVAQGTASFSITFTNFRKDDVLITGGLTVSMTKAGDVFSFAITTPPGNSISITRKVKSPGPNAQEVEVTKTLTLKENPTTMLVIDKSSSPQQTKVSFNVESSKSGSLFATARSLTTQLLDDSTDQPLVFEADRGCLGPKSGAFTLSASLAAASDTSKKATLRLSVAFGYTAETAPAGYHCPSLSGADQMSKDAAQWCSQPCIAVTLDLGFSPKPTVSELQAALEAKAAAVRDQLGQLYLTPTQPIAPSDVLAAIQDRLSPVIEGVRATLSDTELGTILAAQFDPGNLSCFEATGNEPSCTADPNSCNAGEACLCVSATVGNCDKRACVALNSGPACYKWAATCDGAVNKKVLAAVVAFDAAGCKPPGSDVTYFGTVGLTRLTDAQNKKGQLTLDNVRSEFTDNTLTHVTTLNGNLTTEFQSASPFKIGLTADEPGLSIKREVKEGNTVKAACTKSALISALVYEKSESRFKFTFDVALESEGG
ncbi:MAG: hypothetical protein KC492_17150, partial [Myxococcales bacterium]|nr:hypothetical protein [Myxococcales bacterium]